MGYLASPEGSCHQVFTAGDRRRVVYAPIASSDQLGRGVSLGSSAELKSQLLKCL